MCVDTLCFKREIVWPAVSSLAITALQLPWRSSYFPPAPTISDSVTRPSPEILPWCCYLTPSPSSEILLVRSGIYRCTPATPFKSSNESNCQLFCQIINRCTYQALGKVKTKNVFLEIFPKSEWLIPKQGPNPLKPPQITPKIAFFDSNFTFPFPKSYKNPGVGGWVNTFGKDLPKKTFFFIPSLICFDYI